MFKERLSKRDVYTHQRVLHNFFQVKHKEDQGNHIDTSNQTSTLKASLNGACSRNLTISKV